MTLLRYPSRVRAVSFLALIATLAVGQQRTDLYRLADELFSTDPAVRAAARDALIMSRDANIAPALVDSVFFNSAGRAETVAVLEQLLGEKHGTSFKKWFELIGRREDIVPA